MWSTLRTDIYVPIFRSFREHLDKRDLMSSDYITIYIIAYTPLSIGTPKPLIFHLSHLFLGVPIFKHIIMRLLIYLNFGTPKNNEFSIWNKWKIYYF